MILLAAFSIVVCVLALLLWLAAWWLRESIDLPRGLVFFSDTGYESKPGFSMVSHRLGLVGKPDFLIKTSGGIVPVEYKSGLMPAGGPYWNHVVQLGVYLLLVEERYGGQIEYGVIKYRDRSVKVKFSGSLRRRVLSLRDELKRFRSCEVVDVKRNHSSAAMCRSCGFNAVCNEALS